MDINLTDVSYIPIVLPVNTVDYTNREKKNNHIAPEYFIVFHTYFGVIYLMRY